MPRAAEEINSSKLYFAGQERENVYARGEGEFKRNPFRRESCNYSNGQRSPEKNGLSHAEKSNTNRARAKSLSTNKK